MEILINRVMSRRSRVLTLEVCLGMKMTPMQREVSVRSAE